MHVVPLSEKHLGELQLATERALQQWAKNIFAPRQIVSAMERVLLFLKQNGGAERQARHVTSLGLVLGEQIVQLAGWRWMSVSDDGSLNPAVVSPDGTRAWLAIDAATLLVLGEVKCSLPALVDACVNGTPHELVVTL